MAIPSTFVLYNSLSEPFEFHYDELISFFRNNFFFLILFWFSTNFAFLNKNINISVNRYVPRSSNCVYEMFRL